MLIERSYKATITTDVYVNADKTYANLWLILLQVTKVTSNQIFVKSENDTIWSTYFNQQAPTVSVFRIYHNEMNVTNIG